MADNTKTLQMIKENLRTAMRFKRELPEMTDKEQADMIQNYLSQTLNVYRKQNTIKHPKRRSHRRK
ncbi:MAG: hypothetical protein IJT96_10800 [Lachnospiraceae bacterium]|nr:hypothetical protein [Lachnospiraceae bacterium]